MPTNSRANQLYARAQYKQAKAERSARGEPVYGLVEYRRTSALTSLHVCIVVSPSGLGRAFEV